jgi:hypothetical protein
MTKTNATSRVEAKWPHCWTSAIQQLLIFFASLKFNLEKFNLLWSNLWENSTDNVGKTQNKRRKIEGKAICAEFMKLLMEKT